MNAVDLDLIGFALLEKWTPRTPPRPFDPDEEHPLLNPIVLERVFTHFLSSTSSYEGETREELRSLRPVCKAWNEEAIRVLQDTYVCRSSSDVLELDALCRESPAPFIRRLLLRYNELWRTPYTFGFIYSLENLRDLEISAIELEFPVFAFLPQASPNIHRLTFSCTDVYPDLHPNAVSIFPPFINSWVQPWPFLRELLLIRGAFTQNAAKVVAFLLHLVPSIETLEIQSVGNWSQVDHGLTHFANLITQNPALFAKLKRVRIEDEDCNGFLERLSPLVMVSLSQARARALTPRFSFQKTIKNLNLPGSPLPPPPGLIPLGILAMSLTDLTLVQKSKPSYPQMSVRVVEDALSRLVHACAPNLKKLTLVNSSEAALFHAPVVASLVFPKEMPELRYLCLGNLGLRTHSSNKTQSHSYRSGIEQMFPKLDHFEYWIRIFNDIPDVDKDLMLTTLFSRPDGQGEGQGLDDHKRKLKNFHVYTRFRLDHAPILAQIGQTFSSIGSLMLEIEGSLLPEVVRSFKDLGVQRLTLIYYETEAGMQDFDAGITGIPVPACLDLLRQVDAEGRRLQPGEHPELKTAPALADWKGLKKLNISYRHGGIFDELFLTFGLLRMDELEDLELRHFDVKENLLIRLFRRSNLKTMIWGNCRLLPLNHDFPVFHYGYSMTHVLNRMGRPDLKVTFTPEYDGDEESVPNYANLLHYFEYDANLAWTGGNDY